MNFPTSARPLAVNLSARPAPAPTDLCPLCRTDARMGPKTTCRACWDAGQRDNLKKEIEDMDRIIERRAAAAPRSSHPFGKTAAAKVAAVPVDRLPAPQAGRSTTSVPAPELGVSGFRRRIDVSDPRLGIGAGAIVTFSTAPFRASDGDLVMVQIAGAGRPFSGEVSRLGRVVGGSVIVAGLPKPVRLARTLLLGVALWASPCGSAAPFAPPDTRQHDQGGGGIRPRFHARPLRRLR